MVHRTFAHTVVVGYDGSPGSASALEWAAQDARLRRARLHVINVREPLPFVAAPIRSPPPRRASHCCTTLSCGPSRSRRTLR